MYLTIRIVRVFIDLMRGEGRLKRVEQNKQKWFELSHRPVGLDAFFLPCSGVWCWALALYEYYPDPISSSNLYFFFCVRLAGGKMPRITHEQNSVAFGEGEWAGKCPQKKPRRSLPGEMGWNPKAYIVLQLDGLIR